MVFSNLISEIVYLSHPTYNFTLKTKVGRVRQGQGPRPLGPGPAAWDQYPRAQGPPAETGLRGRFRETIHQVEKKAKGFKKHVHKK